MVNNIDLQKLDHSGEKLLNNLTNFEKQRENKNSSQKESLLIIAHIMLQVFERKRDLVKKDEEYSYAFGGFDNYTEDGYTSPWVQSLRAPDFDVFDSAEIPFQDYEGEGDELERQEKEIQKWKGIYKEMSKRLKESKIY